MKNMKNIIKLTISIITALLVIGACSMPGNISVEGENIDSDREKVTLNLNISPDSRTVNYTVSDVKRYELYGTLNGGSAQTLGSWTSTEGMAVGINTGNWSFTLNAYDAVSGGNIILEETKSLSVASDTSLSFTLKPLTDGTGTVDVTLNWPADSGINSVTATYDGADVSGALITTGTSAEYKNTSAAAGNFILVFKLYDSGSRLTGSTIEKVRVRNNLTSSKTITLSTEDLNTAPAAPSGITATSAGSTSNETYASITVTWTDNAKTETGYTIYRDGVEIATVTGGTTSYSDTTAVRGTSYTYSVSASNSFGSSTVTAASESITSPYIITFYHRDSGNSTTSTEANSNGTVTKPADPANSNAESFNGWYTEDTNWTTEWDFNSNTVTANASIYARWNYTVTFNANGGSGSMGAQTITEGASANLSANAFSYPGKTFAGWATTSGGSVAYNNQTSYTMGTSNVTLYAVWTAITHTITFNANGGSGSMSPQVITEGATVNLNANTFSRSDHIFAGWSTIPTGALNYADRQEYTMGSSNETLYAIWTDTSNVLIKLTFDNTSNYCADTSGNNRTCTGHNMSYTNDGNGGYAASFNGSSSYIELPYQTFCRSDFTVMMRFNVGTTGCGALLGYQNTTIPNISNVTAFIPIIIVQADGKVRGTLWTGSWSPNGKDITVLSDTTVNDGNWHTVYFSAKANSIALYLDGSQVGDTEVGTVGALNMYYNQIGTAFGKDRDSSLSGASGTYYFNGLIDNFYLYGTALH